LPDLIKEYEDALHKSNSNVSELKEKIKEFIFNETKLKQELDILEVENKKLKNSDNNRNQYNWLNETKLKNDCLEHSNLKHKIENLQNDVEYYLKELKVRDDLIEYYF
jgi:hypothetical protein